MLSVNELTHPRVRSSIISKILDPIISAVVRHDTLIILFANKLVDKFEDTKQLDMVRRYVRLISKFMLEIKKLTPEIEDFKMVFRSQYYDDVIKVIRIVSNYDDSTQRFGTTYNAETLPLLFRKCFKILRHYSVKTKDANNIQELNDFIGIFEDDI